MDHSDLPPKSDPVREQSKDRLREDSRSERPERAINERREEVYEEVRPAVAYISHRSTRWYASLLATVLCLSASYAYLSLSSARTPTVEVSSSAGAQLMFRPKALEALKTLRNPSKTEQELGSYFDDSFITGLDIYGKHPLPQSPGR